MKIVKALALSFMGFLLFLSLSLFGLALTLNMTILNPDFVVRELDKLDVYSLAEEWIDEVAMQLEVPDSYRPYVDEVMDKTLNDLQPWIGEQINSAVYYGYSYLTEWNQSLNFVISLEPVRDSLKQNLRETVLASPPPELQGLPSGAVELLLSEASRQIDDQIPQSIQFDQGMLSDEDLTVIDQVRQAISYFRLGYWLLLGFIVLLILGIVLIHREVRGATRELGMTFLTCGVITYLGNLATKSLVGAEITRVDMPVQFQGWLPQVLADVLAPLDIYSIILAAIGLALLIVSFVYKPRGTEF